MSLYTVFPQIVSADTINLSHQNNADTIYYSGADTIISCTWWHRRWRQVMKHKCVWTTRSWLVSLFPTRAGVLPLVYVDQFPPSSRASPLALLSASPTTWPQLFVWAGADTNRGRILFDVRILFEEIRYLFEPKFALFYSKKCTSLDEAIFEYRKVLWFYTSSNMAINEYCSVLFCNSFFLHSRVIFGNIALSEPSTIWVGKSGSQLLLAYCVLNEIFG